VRGQRDPFHQQGVCGSAVLISPSGGRDGAQENVGFEEALLSSEKFSWSILVVLFDQEPDPIATHFVVPVLGGLQKSQKLRRFKSDRYEI